MGADPRPHYTNPVTEIRPEDCQALIRMALAEDAPEGDVTSEPIFPPSQRGGARVVSRVSGVLCGRPVVDQLLAEDRERVGLERAVTVQWNQSDGDAFQPGDALARFEGPVADLLRLERIILNFLQYLSGISSVVRSAVDQAGPAVAVLDTRKTLPGYRRLAKYAVYQGGGTNHRIHLSDMAMIKDNHIAAAGGITAAVEKIRAARPDVPLEIEVDTLEQLTEALDQKPDTVLLDNMRGDRLERAVALIRERPEGERPFIEISGGVRPEDLPGLRALGPLGVSMGHLTHTTAFLDLSMEFES